MLPPITYKMHPKMLQIMEEKRKRKEILMQAKDKQLAERDNLRDGRKEYFEENKKQIARKLDEIHERKVIKRNFIREEEKERAVRIAIKKSERLMQLIPERRQLVEMLRNNYLENIKNNDMQKQEKLRQIIEARIVEPQAEIKMEEKIKQNNLIDTNEGICVICLTSEAHIYMVACRHLISCKDCEFILRLQKKCPLCRRMSDYSDLKALKKKKLSTKKQL